MVEEGRGATAIRGLLKAGQTLFTPTARSPFSIKSIDADGVVLLLGKGEHAARLSWECLEGVVPFIEGVGGDVRIGGQNDVEGIPGTLDEYLKEFTTTNTANWVAPLLEASSASRTYGDRRAR